MTLAEKEKELITQLSGIKNAQERFAYIVERGRKQPALEPHFKTDEFRVEGCLSKLWLVTELKEGLCYFRTDADSMIVKSIAAMLCDFYNGHQPAEILASDPSFLAQVGITQHLTPNRRNALSRVWDKIREFAAKYNRVI